MTIDGPAPNFGTIAFSSNPAPTDTALATDEAIRKWDILLVRRRPMAAGRIIKEPARSAPMKRNPTSMVELKSKRKKRSTRSTFTPVAIASSGENRVNTSWSRSFQIAAMMKAKQRSRMIFPEQSLDQLIARCYGSPNSKRRCEYNADRALSCQPRFLLQLPYQQRS